MNRTNAHGWSRPRAKNSIRAQPQRRVVLVADDDREMRRWISCALQSVGYDVVLCDGGEELLERMGSALMNPHETIEVVITDVRMPGFTGLQVLEGLERAHKETPIVLMTAFAGALDDIRTRKHGGVEVLVKPFDVDDLLTAVARVTLQRRLRRGAHAA